MVQKWKTHLAEESIAWLKLQVSFWNLGSLATNDKQNLVDFACAYVHYCCMVTIRDSQSKYD